MTETVSSRPPVIGDVIRTAKPLNCDSLSCRAGQYIHMQLNNENDTAHARDLVASGRWVVVEKGS